MKKIVILLAGMLALLTTSAPIAPARDGALVVPTRPNKQTGKSRPVKPPQTREAVYWTSQDGKTKLFLVRAGSMYSLFVAGGKGLNVAYRTSRNSSQPIVLPLKPVKGSGGCLKEYHFRHSFSRTTIWMALEFAKDGKPVPELKRSFMNGIRPGLR